MDYITRITLIFPPIAWFLSPLVVRSYHGLYHIYLLQTHLYIKDIVGNVKMCPLYTGSKLTALLLKYRLATYRCPLNTGKTELQLSTE